MVSGGAALVNLGSRFLYGEFLGYALAVVSAYLTGIAVNFALSSLFVFKLYAGADIRLVFAKFFAVALLGLGVTTFSAVLAREFLLSLDLAPAPWADFLAHAFGVGASFFASFAGHRLFTYRPIRIRSLVKGKN